MRRAAVLTVIGGLLIATVAPAAVGSATDRAPQAERLLAVLDAPLGDRGTESSRGSSARVSLVPMGQGVSVETLDGSVMTAPPVAPEQIRVGSGAQLVAQPPGSGTVQGTASWYCCTRGWRGQAVVALPRALGGHYDAPPAVDYVVICADRCARIPVVDTCGCHYGTATQKVADLSPEAWMAITDRDRYVYGIVRVTIYLGG